MLTYHPATPGHSTTDAADCPFYSRYQQELPLPLRALATGMTWPQFCDAFAPAPTTPEPTISSDCPVAEMTEALYSRGLTAEILSFHQVAVDEGVATFLLTETNRGQSWTFAVTSDAGTSAARALFTAATR